MFKQVLSATSYIPLAFCLFRDKRKQTYEEVFRIAEEECQRRLLSFQPKTVVIDFEQAIHQAVKSVFPHINVVACRFHLAQVWIVNIKHDLLYVHSKN